MPFEKLKAPFLRVLCIAVQSLMDASPGRGFGSLEAERRIEVRVSRIGAHTIAYDQHLYPRPLTRSRHVLISYTISRIGYPAKAWSTSIAHGRQLLSTRVAAERASATIFTAPYAVQHVSDEAVRIATTLLAAAEMPAPDRVPEE